MLFGSHDAVFHVLFIRPSRGPLSSLTSEMDSARSLCPWGNSTASNSHGKWGFGALFCAPSARLAHLRARAMSAHTTRQAGLGALPLLQWPGGATPQSTAVHAGGLATPPQPPPPPHTSTATFWLTASSPPLKSRPAPPSASLLAPALLSAPSGPSMSAPPPPSMSAPPPPSVSAPPPPSLSAPPPPSMSAENTIGWQFLRQH